MYQFKFLGVEWVGPVFPIWADLFAGPYDKPLAALGLGSHAGTAGGRS